jgi:hypothetical protein
LLTLHPASPLQPPQNLAMFAARDLARRRAARASRLYVPAPAPDPPSSSGTGGILDLGTFKGKNKRSSMFGFLRLPGAGSEDGEGRREEEVGSDTGIGRRVHVC